MKTTLPKENEIVRRWYLIDAAGKPAGRLAVQICSLLRGRGKADYAPHIDMGDSSEWMWRTRMPRVFYQDKPIVPRRYPSDYFQPGDAPEFEFKCAYEAGIVVKAYCNKHGLWQATI